MKITYENIKGFGNPLRLSNGVVNVDVSTSFGPNIVNFAFVGKDGFFFNDYEKKLKVGDKKFEELYGIKGAFWQNYGGHRLWQGPEKSYRTYLPENEEVQIEKTATGAIFRSRKMPWVNTQNETEVVLKEGAEAEILHRIKNLNAWAVEFAPWSVTVLKHGGIEVIPLPQEKTGLLPNACVSLWSYTDLSDERWYFGKKYIMLQPKKVGRPTKIGISEKEKKVYYFMNNMAFVKEFDYDPSKTYIDYGANFETYTDDYILECETLANLQKIEYLESATHKEVWKLFDNVKTPEFKNEEEVEEAIKKTL